ncbi:plasmid mobilization relaxosome protein MobC [Methylosinus sp. PW1]|uniref:plasmid mobilization protein n=1 Tax=Methylosinus sp. PW1 TaxID=107636 RepID=UPI000689CF72|nr:plasmid mobilization relaxosome protein MobC [Methylosinus sp. PW1]
MDTSPDAAKPPRRRAPWRDRKRALDPKDKFVAVRVTEPERVLIAESAKAAGLKIGGYLRALAIGNAGARAKRGAREEREALARILGELGKLGSNVNQIARWCNTDRTAPHLREVELMRADVAAMRAAIMRALDRGD